MKKRVLSIFLALVMVLSLMPGMSITASAEEAEELSEVIAFEKGSAEVESPHFILSAGHSEYYGWFVDSGNNKIVIDAKEPNIIITSVETFVGGDGGNNPDIVYSSGEKVETGAVRNGTIVHVNNINSSSLEIVSRDGTIAFQTFVVRYIISETQSHTHNFTGRFRDNSDGTHSQKCANCYTYGEGKEHTYRPVSKVSDNPLTYTAKCTECSSRIDNFQIDAISFNFTDWADYGGIGGVGVGDTLKRGTKLRAVYAFGDYNMIVYIDGVRAATVVGGQFWELPQCVRCTDYDTNWLQPWEDLEIWFETVCDYTLATCDSPSVCMYCGRTVAEAPGHPWKSATCTEPKICLDCGRTEGGPLGHNWMDATCTAPKTCARCGVTEGDTLEHTYDVVDGSIKCTACGKLFVPEIVETKISYIDRTWNEETKTVVDTEKEHEGIIYVDENTTMIGNDNWYVVNSEVTNTNRIKVGGTANLILCDGASLKATAGISVTSGNTLNIYGQSGDIGKLIANGPSDSAGIGSNGSGNGGTVNIYGGTVTATSAQYGTGIGGGYRGNGGNITVYGGTVNATGGRLGAGIGGGAGGNCGTVTVYGGTVNATGVDHGAGIGGGTVSKGGTVIINGGVVNAKGGVYAAGIGGAEKGADVIVNGGTVTVVGGNSCKAIGAGYGSSDDGTVTVAETMLIKGGDNADNLAVISEVGGEKYVYITDDTPYEHTHIFNQEITDAKYLKSSATCTEAAVYYKSCECGEASTTDTFTNGKALGHTWDNGKVTTPATHMAEGVMTYTCTKCGATKTESIAKLTAHTFNKEVVNAKYLKSAATCTEAAVYYKSCECGETSTTDTFTSGEALGHTWDNGKVTTPATHMAEGVMTYICTKCGATMTEPIAKLTAHTFDKEVVDAKYLKSAATCTNAAEYYKSCECGEKGTNTFTYGEALGHSFTNYISDGNATCTADGTKTAKCDNCDATDTQPDVGSATGHHFVDGKCVVCGYCTYLPGDVNGDGEVTDADAVYLLYYTFFGDEEYPINQPCDFNGDGEVTDADAVYLLYYSFFGEEEYPLH